MLCTEWTLVKHTATGLFAEPLKCRCWSCEYCQPSKSRALKREAFAGRPDTFLTLTVNPNVGIDAHDRARSLARAWRLLRLRAMRRYRYKALPFLCVFEKTQNGEPHLHVLLRSPWLDQKWLSEQMDNLIAAPIVDIRRVRGAAKAAAYVAKYVGKDPEKFIGTKRYWSSRDYQLPPEVEDDRPPLEPATFQVMRCGLREYLEGQTYWGFIHWEVEKGLHQLRYNWRASQQQAQRPP